jgi:hypothetical protein
MDSARGGKKHHHHGCERENQATASRHRHEYTPQPARRGDTSIRQFKSRVIVATENAKFFYFISKELARDIFRFNHFRPAEIDRKRCPSDTVVITTSSEVASLPPELLILSYDEGRYPLNEPNVQNFYHMFRILMDTGIDECSQIDVGIDPGSKHTGLALFLNGTFVEATIINGTFIEATARIKEFLAMAITTGLQNCKENTMPSIRVKIGNGSPVEMHKVVGLLLKMQQSYAIEILLVDESHSNTDFVIKESRFIKIGDHARAAVNIALREGMSLEQARKTPDYQAGTKKSIKKKQVKNVQAESRVASGEDGITIDQKLATKVLLGKMSLQEAIALYKQDAKDRIMASKGTSNTS